MTRRLNTIERKLTAHILGFSILFGLLFSAVQIGYDYYAGQQRFQHATAQLLQRQQGPAELALYQYDQQALISVLDSLLLNAGLVASQASDESGKLYHVGLPAAQLLAGDDAHHYHRHSIELLEPDAYSPDRRRIGWLHVWFDDRLTQPGFERRAMLMLVLDVLRYATLAVILILLLRARIASPVKRIMQRLVDVDPHSPVNLALTEEHGFRSQELDGLVTKMNSLLGAMQTEIRQRLDAENRVLRMNEQLEEKVRDRTRQLQTSLDELQRTQDLLLQAQRMASLGHLAAGIAHEINNPVAVVYSNIATLSEYLTELVTLADEYQLAEHDISDPQRLSVLKQMRTRMGLDFIRSDAPDLIRTSRQSLERVRNIVSELRTFADSDRYHKEPSNLAMLVASVVHDMRLDQSDRFQLVCQLEALPEVPCVPQQIRLVLRNLLDNACDAMPDGGTIELAGVVSADALTVEVKDTGNGMSADDLQCAMDPFFTRKEIGKGTGLGLTVAYNIMQHHGGELLLDSTLGQGTVVTLRFPLAGAATE